MNFETNTQKFHRLFRTQRLVLTLDLMIYYIQTQFRLILSLVSFEFPKPNLSLKYILFNSLSFSMKKTDSIFVLSKAET